MMPLLKTTNTLLCHDRAVGGYSSGGAVAKMWLKWALRSGCMSTSLVPLPLATTLNNKF